MKRYAMLFVLLTMAASLSWADGAATYKAKCAMCHGPAGEGKIGPKLQGTKISEGDITTFLTTGAAGKKGPHSKPVNGLSADDAKAVAAYVKTL
jgi:mono/diheme cytochrome c family protein